MKRRLSNNYASYQQPLHPEALTATNTILVNTTSSSPSSTQTSTIPSNFTPPHHVMKRQRTEYENNRNFTTTAALPMIYSYSKHSLNDMNYELLRHIFSYVSNQKELLSQFTSVCRRFCLCILHPEYKLWSSFHQESSRCSTTASESNDDFGRTFYYGWYGTNKLKTPIDEIVNYQKMSRLELCDTVLCSRQLINIIKCDSIRSLKLFRIRLRKDQHASSPKTHLASTQSIYTSQTMEYAPAYARDFEPDVSSMLQRSIGHLESLWIDCCNDLPTQFLDNLLLRCTGLKSVNFRDTSCVTNDTIDSLFLLQPDREVRGSCSIVELTLKNLPFVTHEAVCSLLRQCPNLGSLSIESCKRISEWKLVKCLTESDSNIAKQLRFLSLIGLDSIKNRVVTGTGNHQNHVTLQQVSIENIQIMQQLVQQTVINTSCLDCDPPVVFSNLKHLILQNCNDQFTNIVLNRVVHGMSKGQLHTLKLSTNAAIVSAQPSSTTSAAGAIPHRPFLIQKEKYHGLLALKELDVNMSSLHPSFVTNLLYACCSQVTALTMSCGTFFNKGLMLFTKSAKNVSRLSLTDCSFESSHWFTIIAYNLPNLRDWSVKRVHVKSAANTIQPQQQPQQPPASEDQAALPDVVVQSASTSQPDRFTATRPHTTQIRRVCIDSLYGLMGIDEQSSKSLNDVSELGRLLIYSPKTEYLDIKNVGKWEVLTWLSKSLGHIPKHNSLTLKMTLKSKPNENIVQDLVYIPRLYMFPPCISTIDMQIESNGFNSHLLMALCCENVQHKVNIILSDQCESELVAMLDFSYANTSFTYYSSTLHRVQDVLVKQIKERIRDLVTQGIQGPDNSQKEEMIQKYLAKNTFEEFVKCNHLTSLLNNCVEYLLDHDKQQREYDNDDCEYSTIVGYYDESDEPDFYGKTDNLSLDSSSCSIM